MHMACSLTGVREPHYSRHLIKKNESSSPEEVAKTILAAVTSDNPQLRDTVGSDAATMIQARVSKSDNEFKEMIMQNFFI